MTAYDVWIKYLELLLRCMEWDIWWYSQWWTWAFIAIPALFYVFFLIPRWIFLTAPLWGTVGAICAIIRSFTSRHTVVYPKGSTPSILRKD